MADKIQNFGDLDRMLSGPAPSANAPLAPPPGSQPPQQIAGLIDQYAAQYGVDPDLAHALANQESGERQYRQNGQEIVSPKGAIGALQLMPETAKRLRVDPHDPEQNVKGGLSYLGDLLMHYDGDESKALSAYFGGTANLAPTASDGLSTVSQYVQNILSARDRRRQQMPPITSFSDLDNLLGPQPQQPLQPTPQGPSPTGFEMQAAKNDWGAVGNSVLHGFGMFGGQHLWDALLETKFGRELAEKTLPGGKRLAEVMPQLPFIGGESMNVSGNINDPRIAHEKQVAQWRKEGNTLAQVVDATLGSVGRAATGMATNPEMLAFMGGAMEAGGEIATGALKKTGMGTAHAELVSDLMHSAVQAGFTTQMLKGVGHAIWQAKDDFLNGEPLKALDTLSGSTIDAFFLWGTGKALIDEPAKIRARQNLNQEAQAQYGKAWSDLDASQQKELAWGILAPNPAKPSVSLERMVQFGLQPPNLEGQTAQVQENVARAGAAQQEMAGALDQIQANREAERSAGVRQAFEQKGQDMQAAGLQPLPLPPSAAAMGEGFVGRAGQPQPQIAELVRAGDESESALRAGLIENGVSEADADGALRLLRTGQMTPGQLPEKLQQYAQAAIDARQQLERYRQNPQLLRDAQQADEMIAQRAPRGEAYPGATILQPPPVNAAAESVPIVGEPMTAEQRAQRRQEVAIEEARKVLTYEREREQYEQQKRTQAQQQPRPDVVAALVSGQAEPTEALVGEIANPRNPGEVVDRRRVQGTESELNRPATVAGALQPPPALTPEAAPQAPAAVEKPVEVSEKVAAQATMPELIEAYSQATVNGDEARAEQLALEISKRKWLARQQQQKAQKSPETPAKEIPPTSVAQTPEKKTPEAGTARSGGIKTQISDEQAGELRAKLQAFFKKPETLYQDEAPKAPPLPPEIVDALFDYGLYHYERGTSNFGAWSKALVSDIDPAVEPHLKRVFRSVEQAIQAARESLQGPHPDQRADTARRASDLERAAQHLTKAAEHAPAPEISETLVDEAADARRRADDLRQQQREQEQQALLAKEKSDGQPMAARIPIIQGKETTVEIPGREERNIPAVYAVVNLKDTKPSNVPYTWEQNQNSFQPRNAYGEDKAVQQKILDRGRNPRFSKIINTNPDQVNGPSTIRADGLVAGGNQRDLIEKILYNEGRGEEYRQYLVDHATEFGIDPSQIPPVTTDYWPVIKRVMTAEPTDKAEMFKIGDDLNLDPTGSYSEAERDAAAARKLDDGTFETLAHWLGEYGWSIRDLMREKDPYVKDIMQRSGMIPMDKRSEFIGPDERLTEDAKQLFEGVLWAKVFDDPSLYARARKEIPGVLNTMERTLPLWARLKAKGGAWDISDYAQEALRLQVAADSARPAFRDWQALVREWNRDSHNVNDQKPTTNSLIDWYLHPDEYKLTTGDLFGAAGEGPTRETRVDPITESIAKELESKPQDFREALTNYVESAERGDENQVSLIPVEPQQPWEAFEQYFAKPNGVKVAAEDWGQVQAVKQPLAATKEPANNTVTTGERQAAERPLQPTPAATVAVPRNTQERREAKNADLRDRVAALDEHTKEMRKRLVGASPEDRAEVERTIQQNLERRQELIAGSGKPSPTSHFAPSVEGEKQEALQAAPESKPKATAKAGSILYESGDYSIRKAAKGYEVYKNGATASERVAQIGYEGERGFERAKQEIERRQGASESKTALQPAPATAAQNSELRAAYDYAGTDHPDEAIRVLDAERKDAIRRGDKETEATAQKHLAAIRQGIEQKGALEPPPAAKSARFNRHEAETDQDIVRGAVQTFEGAPDRWAKLKETGATDEQLREAIGREFGNSSGMAGQGGFTAVGAIVDFKGGNSPSVTIKRGAERTVIKGKQLVDMVRSTFEIPEGAKKSEVTGADVINEPAAQPPPGPPPEKQAADLRDKINGAIAKGDVKKAKKLLADLEKVEESKQSDTAAARQGTQPAAEQSLRGRTINAVKWARSKLKEIFPNTTEEQRRAVLALWEMRAKQRGLSLADWVDQRIANIEKGGEGDLAQKEESFQKAVEQSIEESKKLLPRFGEMSREDQVKLATHDVETKVQGLLNSLSFLEPEWREKILSQYADGHTPWILDVLRERHPELFASNQEGEHAATNEAPRHGGTPGVLREAPAGREAGVAEVPAGDGAQRGERAGEPPVSGSGRKANGAAAGVEDDKLFQGDHKAAVSFLEDGKAIIRGFAAGDVSSLVHETAHIFRRDLSPEELNDAHRIWGVEGGTWAREHEERFARDFERYAYDGQTPDPKARPIFEKFKTWLRSIYSYLIGSPLEQKLTPEKRGFFHDLLGIEHPEVESTTKTEPVESKAAVKEEPAAPTKPAAAAVEARPQAYNEATAWQELQRRFRATDNEWAITDNGRTPTDRTRRVIDEVLAEQPKKAWSKTAIDEIESRIREKLASVPNDIQWRPSEGGPVILQPPPSRAAAPATGLVDASGKPLAPAPVERAPKSAASNNQGMLQPPPAKAGGLGLWTPGQPLTPAPATRGEFRETNPATNQRGAAPNAAAQPANRGSIGRGPEGGPGAGRLGPHGESGRGGIAAVGGEGRQRAAKTEAGTEVGPAAVKRAPGTAAADKAPGAKAQTLKSVPNLEVAAPRHERGTPLYSVDSWRQRLHDLGIAEDAPVPTRALRPDLRAKLLPGQPEIADFLLSGLGQHDGAVLATGTGTGKCGLPHQLIVTDLGLFTLQELWEHMHGDEFATHDGLGSIPRRIVHVPAFNGETLEWKPIVATYRQRVSEPIKRVRYHDGTELEVTLEHALLSPYGWTKSPKVGDYLAVPATLPEPENPASEDDNLLAILAWQVTEGCERLTGFGSFSITQADKTLLDLLKMKFAALASANGWKWSARVAVNRKKKGNFQLLTYCSGYRRYLESRGYEWGKLSGDKKMPAWVLAIPNEQLRRVLSIMFEAEGSAATTQKFIEFSSKSKHLARFVHIALRRFGVWSSIRSKQVKGQTYYRVNISGRDATLFHSNIGFLSTEKNSKLLRFVEQTGVETRYGYPLQGIIQQTCYTVGLPPTQISADGSGQISKQRLIGAVVPAVEVIARNGFYTRLQSNQNKKVPNSRNIAVKAAPLVELLMELRTWAVPSIHFAKVDAVAYEHYDGEVYDFEVADTHNFVLEGAISHNSFISAALLANEQPERALILTKNGKLVKDYIKIAKDHFGVEVKELPQNIENLSPGYYIATHRRMADNIEAMANQRWNLGLIDESAEARRWQDSAQGAAMLRLNDAMDKTIYMSATPFHIPTEVGYMGKLGLWDGSTFAQWAHQLGARVDPESGRLVSGPAPRKMAKLRQQLLERGQMISWDKDLNGFQAHFGIVPTTDEVRQGMNNALRAFGMAEEWFVNKNKGGMVRAVRGNQATFLKNYLERARLDQAIQLAKQAEEKGWKTIFFSENKREVPEIYDFLKQPDDSPEINGKISALMPKLPGVVETLQNAFGDELANFSGGHSAAREAELEDFLTGRKKHLFATYGAGGVGVSLHDTVGDAPRLAIYLGLPWSGVMFDQAIGRPFRFNTKSDVHAVFLGSDAPSEMQLLVGKIGPRLTSLRAAVSGVASQNDPVVQALHSVDGALDYDQGGTHRAASNDEWTVPYRKGAVQPWDQIQIADAKDAMGPDKGLKMPYSDVELAPAEGEAPKAMAAAQTLYQDEGAERERILNAIKGGRPKAEESPAVQALQPAPVTGSRRARLTERAQSILQPPPVRGAGAPPNGGGGKPPIEPPESAGPVQNPDENRRPPSIQRLTTAIAQEAKPDTSVADRMRIGVQKATSDVGDAAGSVAQALAKLKGATAGMYDGWKRGPKGDDYDTLTRQWSGADNESALNIQRFQKQISDKVPDRLRQQAISRWIEANGDEATLRDWAQRTAANPKTAKLAPVYEAALGLTESEKNIAREIQQHNADTLKEAQAHGMLRDGVDNYVQHVWKNAPTVLRKLQAEQNFTSLIQNPGWMKKRTLPTYFDGEQLGFEPAHDDVGSLVAAHERSFREAIAARAYVQGLHGGEAEDGRPLVAESWAKAKIVGEGDEDMKGVKFIQANLKPGQAFGDYIQIDHPALRNWSFVSKDSSGRPIFAQGDLWVHPDIYRKLKNNLTKSAVRSYTIEIGGHEFKPGEAALKLSSEIKHVILSFAGFHQTTLGVHALEHRTLPAGMPEIDLDNKDQRGLVYGGLMVAHYDALEQFGEGVSSGGLITKTPILGPLYGQYANYLFKDYISRLKMAMGLHALGRNRERYPNLSDEQLYAMTADQANAAFGGLNYRVLGRSKTLQDVLRLTFMAPDFMEARGRFAAQALKPYGREQRHALAIGAAVLWTAGRILNQMLDDDPHWADHPFSVVHNGKEYALRTIQEDCFNLLTDPGRFFRNRLSPLAGAGVELTTGRDSFGRRQGVINLIQSAPQNTVPIPLQSVVTGKNNTYAQDAAESMWRMIGVNVRSEHQSDLLQNQGWLTPAPVQRNRFIETPSFLQPPPGR